MKKQKKKSSLRLKLIGIIAPIVLLLIVAFFVLSRKMVLSTSQDKMIAESQVYTENITAWVNKIFSELEVYKIGIEGGVFATDDELLDFLELSYEKSDAYPVGLYMGDDSGVYLDGSGWVPGSDWVLTERDWYVDGKDNDTLSFGEPYYDSMTGDVCVSASVRINYSKAVRVLATDVYLDYVAELITDISEQTGLGAFLVTQNSRTIIAHPDVNMIATSLDTAGYDSLYANIAAALNDSTDDIVLAEGDADDYYVSLNKVDNTDWYLVTYISKSDMLSDLYHMELYMVIIAVIAAALLIFAILSVTGRVIKPVEKVTNVIGKIAEGDFTQNLEVSGNDEIAIMSNNMQSFISQMRNTITEINDTALWLNKQSAENEEISGSLMTSSDNQGRSMELLNKFAEELQNAANETSSQMDVLAELIKKTSEDGNTAKELMTESVELSQSGRSAMENINDGMNSINQSISTLSLQIGKVGEAMTQINDMVSIIMSISEETSLLSLNASIEAARAGEAGKGFSVVAEQIGKLATNSNVAADDIARLTSEIDNIVNEAIVHMNSSVDEVKKNVEIVSEARSTFVDLYGKVDETSQRVEQMIEQIDKADNIAEHMDEITDAQLRTTVQIVESAGTMNENVENVAANSKIVAESAEELKKESMSLMEKMSTFKIEA